MEMRADESLAVPSHLGASPIGHLAEQLWAGPLASGEVRLRTGRGYTASPPEWQCAERYLAVPSVARAKLLLPADGRAVTRAALLNYRGLRRAKQNLQRRALAAPMRAGLNLPFARLSLERRVGSSIPLPVELLASALERGPLAAAIGIRTGANRKATLQLVDMSGAAAGFAKFAWDPASRTGIERETRALAARPATAPSGAAASAPRLVHQGQFHGWPYLVTSPLPADVRGVRADVPAPTAHELYTLTPLARRATASSTEQFRTLLADVTQPTQEAEIAALRSRVGHLLNRISRSPAILPTVARWHGDLTPWNCARDGRGHLWCWDWESSEPDALAGMDAVHWHTGVAVESGSRFDGRCLVAALARARPYLVAAGVPRAGSALVAGVYAATMTERACALAVGVGGWEEGWVLPKDLHDLLDAADGLLADYTRDASGHIPGRISGHTSGHGTSVRLP
ncbi:MAG: hypothetical protein ACRCYQ_11865 [Nocardioides sp.]